jgi:predicted O-methyltransferase YrrM
MVVIHRRPAVVIETGVARGLTTRFVLEAMERNGTGHLWSIDLPPPRARELHDQVGVAVPPELRAHWSYVRGSTRRRLPRLLDELHGIDLFIHDSRHSARNLLFELRSAWSELRPGGVLIADDIDLNCGFHTFKAEHGDADSLNCLAEPLEPDVGRHRDRGLFAIVLK